MRSLIFVALLLIVGFALFRNSRPVEVVGDSGEVSDRQPAAVDLDDTRRMELESIPFKTVRPPDLSPERLAEIHEKNDEGFRRAPGNGRTRRGPHVLMKSGGVVFVTDTIKAGDDDFEELKRSADGSKNPYGLWGAFGTRPKTADHSFQKLSRQPLQQQDIDDWQIELIQLVSVNHLWAYDDDELPSMKEIQDASIGTRPLNEFESQSVTKLQQGEQLVIKRSDDSILMIGAIRATSKCLACHTDEKTDLLGAFSYRIKRNKEEPDVQ